VRDTDGTSKELIVGVTIAGAHRGARHHAAAVRELAEELPASRHLIRLIDAAPQRALRLASEVTENGGHGFALEARLEEALPVLGTSHEPLILAVDSPRTAAMALLAPETRERWVFAYSLMRLPSGLLSLRGAVPPGESHWREQTVALLSELADVSAERGAEYVLGAKATSAARAGEARHRGSMAQHLKRHLRRVVAELPLEGPSLTLSDDGLSELPLFVVSRESWQDPAALGRQVLAEQRVPLPRGQDFAVCEAAQGLRFHLLRHRSDGKLMVRGRHMLDVAALRRAAAAAEAAAEAERQARRTLSLTNPADVTD
jgi:hypothetical protein